LVDPVFCGHASPFSFSIKAFTGADIYRPDDIPDIDYLFITHDHWDHLDYDTVKKLRPRVKQVICGLGTGAHLEYWGFDKKSIIEKDWNETFQLGDGFTVNTVPGRHFSGRMFRRNQSVWTSFVLQTPTMKLFLGGDSGYDSHFAAAGEKFGPFDLVILENGQYNKYWKYIHMMPEEVLKAAIDLKAKRLLSVHHAKFALANHSWDEPLSAITALNKKERVPLITPMIGEKVNLKDSTQVFKEWWKEIS
jgi:L-ascorbate metabolism protein UlaG (beta-lactamase superfamily)